MQSEMKIVCNESIKFMNFKFDEMEIHFDCLPRDFQLTEKFSIKQNKKSSRETIKQQQFTFWEISWEMYIRAIMENVL